MNILMTETNAQLVNSQQKWPIALAHLLPVSMVIILSLLAYFFEHELLNSLVYQRELINQGELWRMLTGHFFHTNNNHLLLNLAGLILLWSLHGQYYQLNNYVLLFVFSGLFISTYLYYLSPQLIQYVGLSGILHSVFIWGAIKDIQHKIKSGYLLLIGVLIKVTHEQFYGASDHVMKLINANVAIEAHLAGVIAGIIFIVLIYLSNFFLLKK